MSELHRLFKAAERATEPDPQAIDNLNERLSARRLRHDASASRRPPVPRLVLGGTLLFALSLGVVLLTRGLHTEPATLSVRLASPSPTVFRPVPALTLTLEGEGELAGTERAPHIHLEAGSLDVELEPDQGVGFSVETGEATVTVHGTSFQVLRDALGTRVSVREGRVSTSCVDGRYAMLEASSQLLCTPVRPAGILGRARALRDQGASTEALETIDALITSSEGSDAVRGEALALKAQLLLLLARPEEAAQTAARYLQEGHSARVEEMRSILTPLAPPSPSTLSP